MIDSSITYFQASPPPERVNAFCHAAIASNVSHGNGQLADHHVQDLAFGSLHTSWLGLFEMACMVSSGSAAGEEVVEADLQRQGYYHGSDHCKCVSSPHLWLHLQSHEAISDSHPRSAGPLAGDSCLDVPCASGPALLQGSICLSTICLLIGPLCLSPVCAPYLLCCNCTLLYTWFKLLLS